MKKMEQIKLSLLLLLFSVSITVSAVSLPSQSYSVYNNLYQRNQDNVSIGRGTTFKNINMVLQSGNNEWGDTCVDEYGPKSIECRTCCGDLLEEIPQDQQGEYRAMHTACLNVCNTGLPLGGAPLDVSLWFILPLCGAYGVLQRIRNRKKETA